MSNRLQLIMHKKL